MARNNATQPAESDQTRPANAVETLPWTSLGHEVDGGQHGLTPLLLHRLAQTVSDSKITIAQLLVNRLITFALDGHFGSLEEILIRIDGDTKSSEPAVKSARYSVMAGELATAGLLDAMYDASKDSPDA